MFVTADLKSKNNFRSFVFGVFCEFCRETSCLPAHSVQQ